MASQSSILFIVSSHSQLGNSGLPTGSYLPEVAHAYYELNSEFRIVFASPAGGIPPLDPGYASDEECVKFLKDPVAQAAFNSSTRLTEVVSGDYVAVFFPGGHGLMYDLATDKTSHQITREIYEAGGIVGAVCHGPAGLVNVRLSTGDFLVAGKKVTAFSNSEEDEVDKTKYMPFLLEDQFRANGGIYSKHENNWGEHVVVDGRLVTGQNPAAAKQSAIEVQRLLKK